MDSFSNSGVEDKGWLLGGSPENTKLMNYADA